MEINQIFTFDTFCAVINSDFKDHEHFDVVLRTVFDINNNLSEQVKDWINKFSEVTSTNWIVSHQIGNPKRFLFKKVYKCQRNEKNKSKIAEVKKHSRNLNCNATITFLVKKITRGTIRNDSLLKDGLNTEIKINFEHQHSVNVEEALSYLRVNQKTKDLFFKYFDMGMTPAAAREYHKLYLASDEDLMTNFSFIKTIANPQINPRSRQIYALHDEWRKLHFGDRTNDSMPTVLNNKKSEYQANGVEMLIENDNVALITPIMRRSHEMDFAEDIIFVDSSQLCGKTKTVVTFFFGSSKIGAIPMGVVLHTGHNKDDYFSAFKLLKTLIGPQGFGGRGEPKIFMTDDSTTERIALQTLFPNSTLLLWSFHVLQSVWRWLCNSKHQIHSNDRKHLINMFRKVMYASNENECIKEMNNLKMDNFSKKNVIYLNYVDKLWRKKMEWCLCFYSKLPTRGNNTNNIVEASIQMFKDIMLERCKPFNMCALVDFIANVFERYHRVRLINYAKKLTTKNQLCCTKYVNAAKHLIISKITDDMYEVQSSTNKENKYNVFSDINMCECIKYQVGAFCKHLYAVHEKYSNITTVPMLSTIDRARLVKLALGDLKKTDETFFGDMISLNASFDFDQSNNESNQNNEISLCDTEGNDNNTENNCPYQESNLQINTKQYDFEIQRLKNNFNSICDLVTTNKEFSMINFFKKANTNLEKVQTPAQLLSLFVHLGKRSMKKNINVQPTAISRRKDRTGLTKGSKIIQVERPSNVETIQRKKKEKSKEI